MTTSSKKPGKQLLKVLISAVLLGLIFANTGIESTLKELSSANLWYIPLGVLIYVASQLVSSYRWKSLAAPLGFRLSLREFFDYYMMGMYLSLFLPSAIGGDVGRVYYLAKSSDKKKREALLTILAERSTGLAALLTLTTIALFLPANQILPDALRPVFLMMTIGGVVTFLLLQVIPTSRFVQSFPKLQLLQQAEGYWRDWPLLIKTLGLSLITHACMTLIHLLIAAALDIQVNALYLFAVYGMVSLLSVIPITFNGIGIREGAYQKLLVLYGITPEKALAFGLYWFLISSITSILGGLIMVKGHYKTPTPEETDAPDKNVVLVESA